MKGSGRQASVHLPPSVSPQYSSSSSCHPLRTSHRKVSLEEDLAKDFSSSSMRFFSHPSNDLLAYQQLQSGDLVLDKSSLLLSLTHSSSSASPPSTSLPSFSTGREESILPPSAVAASIPGPPQSHLQPHQRLPARHLDCPAGEGGENSIASTSAECIPSIPSSAYHSDSEGTGERDREREEEEEVDGPSCCSLSPACIRKRSDQFSSAPSMARLASFSSAKREEEKDHLERERSRHLSRGSNDQDSIRREDASSSYPFQQSSPSASSFSSSPPSSSLRHLQGGVALHTPVVNPSLHTSPENSTDLSSFSLSSSSSSHPYATRDSTRHPPAGCLHRASHDDTHQHASCSSSCISTGSYYPNHEAPSSRVISSSSSPCSSLSFSSPSPYSANHVYAYQGDTPAVSQGHQGHSSSSLQQAIHQHSSSSPLRSSLLIQQKEERRLQIGEREVEERRIRKKWREEEEKKKKASKQPRPLRACPEELSQREIFTKPGDRLLPAALMNKYRCPAGQGIQVPALRLESAPMKLSNWRVSWQEVLCYNSRSYAVTPAFEENYQVMRQGIEHFISPITDIVFVDRNSAHLTPAYVYHAYLLPPICPHEYSTAACIQCYTSDDLWLSRGAWKRFLSSTTTTSSHGKNSIPGIAGGSSREEERLRRRGLAAEKAEVLHPNNPLLIPFAPPSTEEEKHRQHQAYRTQDGHLLYLDHEDHLLRLSSSSSSLSSSLYLQGYRDVPGEDTRGSAGRDLHGLSSLQPRNSLVREKKKLPLHLWIFLGGKDMQALDGIVLAWKFLRFASEIPPSEFVGDPGEKTLFQHERDRIPSQEQNSQQWGDRRLPPISLYTNYHQAGRNPGMEQTTEAANGTTPRHYTNKREFNPFGPLLYDLSGVSEEKKYRISFLMIDTPGYGNSSGHPSPDTIRSSALQSVKHALMELIEHHGEEEIILNILGYSLGSAVALALAADIAESIYNDLLKVSPSSSSSSSSPPLYRPVRSKDGVVLRSVDEEQRRKRERVIPTATKVLSEQVRASKWEGKEEEKEDLGRPRDKNGVALEKKERKRRGDGTGGKIHSSVSFDPEKNLTFQDTCHLILYENVQDGSACISKLASGYASKPRGASHVYNSYSQTSIEEEHGLKLSVNRLVLLSPFTSIQAMASRVAAATVGGGGLISRAASALVSRQINWNNESAMKRLFESIHKIKTKIPEGCEDAYRNFRLYIQHGDRDTIIPWTMGYELFALAKSLRNAYQLSYLPLKFDRMPGENHATILSGRSELTLLENCFCPYRLHPASPIALLKFYSRLTHLPAYKATATRLSHEPPHHSSSVIGISPKQQEEQKAFLPQAGLSKGKDSGAVALLKRQNTAIGIVSVAGEGERREKNDKDLLCSYSSYMKEKKRGEQDANGGGSDRRRIGYVNSDSYVFSSNSKREAVGASHVALHHSTPHPSFSRRQDVLSSSSPSFCRTTSFIPPPSATAASRRDGTEDSFLSSTSSSSSPYSPTFAAACAFPSSTTTTTTSASSSSSSFPLHSSSSTHLGSSSPSPAVSSSSSSRPLLRRTGSCVSSAFYYPSTNSPSSSAVSPTTVSASSSSSRYVLPHGGDLFSSSSSPSKPNHSVVLHRSGSAGTMVLPPIPTPSSSTATTTYATSSGVHTPVGGVHTPGNGGVYASSNGSHPLSTNHSYTNQSKGGITNILPKSGVKAINSLSSSSSSTSLQSRGFPPIPPPSNLSYSYSSSATSSAFPGKK